MNCIEWGDPLPAVDPTLLKDQRLRVLLQACVAHPSFEVVELRRVTGEPGFDLIIVDVGDGAVAPNNAVGIHRRERLALLYHDESGIPFQVRALRTDFPETLHQNGTRSGEPKSLCLYELDWDTVERSWTPQKLLASILRWLEKTADGTLHASDQALEQVFYGSGLQLVLPFDFASKAEDPAHMLRLHKAGQTDNRIVLIGTMERADGADAQSLPYQVLRLAVEAVAHPPVQSPPFTLGELQERLEQAGSSLTSELVQLVRAEANGGVTPNKGDQRKKILLLVRIPRKRHHDVERVDVAGFLLEADLAGLGLALGVLQQTQPGGPAFPFQALGVAEGNDVPGDGWREISLFPIDVRRAVSRADARQWSGVPADEGEFRGVLAGVGALGGALADLWTRSGWGCWDYIDPDLVEPHNVVRHVARQIHIGHPKAYVVRALGDAALGEHCTDTRALHAKANDLDNTDVMETIARADLLVDATTTLAVPRDWSERDAPRTASVFLTPSGLGSVLLLEDATRSIRTASLEAQYYRALLREPWGERHLATETAFRRTGAGCRDRSLVMPAEHIQLHASLLARRLRLHAHQPDARIDVWSASQDASDVSFHPMPARMTRQTIRGDWKIYWDDGLEEQLYAMRKQALPNETGGILVGVTDHKLRTIHLVDAFPAPSDSDASPDGFTRGQSGVDVSREAVLERTNRMVDYVGEWHSHPKGIGSQPSCLDVVLLASLTDRLAADGIPAVMLIAAETGVSISLGSASGC